jgi:lipoate-protein ligase A
MLRRWWLVESAQLAPCDNMALDRALLRRAIETGRTDPVVRVYGWSPPTLSVGAKIDLPAEVARRCAASGVPVVRRDTGGGCVLHDGDVTYSVVAPEEGRSVLEAYRWVSAGLIAGLCLLGIEAGVTEHPSTGRHLDCFRAATGADLSTGGRKLCGSAQVRRQGWFLQQGSIPVHDVRDQMAGLLGQGDPGSEDRSTWLDRVKPGITWQDLGTALVAGFAAAWGTSPLCRAPEAQERPHTPGAQRSGGINVA